MSRFYQALTILVVFLTFAGVSARAAAAQGSVYPVGLDASGIAGGIYPGTNAGNCCWMGERATLHLTVPRSADTLLINVYLPRFAAQPGGQALFVQMGSAPPVERCCFGPGEHELSFAIPPRSRGTALRLLLRARRTFVPKAIGLNDDPRRLSVLVRELSFENSATGEQFRPNAPPWLAPRTALLLLLLAGLAVFALTLRRPLFGLAALILTDPFLFAYAAHGTTATLPKVALLAVAAGVLPRLPQFARERGRFALYVLAGAQVLFAVTMLPAAQHAVFHGPALRETFKALQFAATGIVAYAAYRLDPDEDAVRLCLSLLTVLVTLLAFAQLFAGAVQSEMVAGHDLPRLAGPLEGPNQLAGFLGIVVPAMLAFAVLRAPLAIERLAIALGCVACVMTFSRGGIGALAIAIVLLSALRYGAHRRAVGAVTLAAFAASLALAFGVFAGAIHGPVTHLFGRTGDDAFNGGLGSRIDLWHGAYELWRSHPLFGIGPGNFEYAIGRFDPGVRTHANGMYFQVLAEQGITGLLAMLLLVCASAGVFLRRLGEPLVLGALAAAVAMAFHQIVDCMWIYEKVGIMFWIVLGLGAAGADLASASERVPEGAVA